MNSRMEPAWPPGLYIVATPIGNLGDISARATDALRSVAAVACEDTRVTGKLLSHLGIKQRLIRYDDHAGEAERERLLALASRQPVALVSDAGTPLISDPG
jgi:16S rRNA (cytidine1402-2'-O)-methyltransferase